MGAPGISDFLDQKNVSQLNQAGSEIGLLIFRLNKSVAEVASSKKIQTLSKKVKELDLAFGAALCFSHLSLDSATSGRLKIIILLRTPLVAKQFKFQKFTVGLVNGDCTVICMIFR